MNAADLLAQFRTLGGVADNVTVRRGAHGLGLFAIDPRRPVRVLTPSQLLISPQSLRLDAAGQVKVKPDSGLSAEVVSFHEGYQRWFGWGAGGLEHIRQYQQQLRSLPASVKNFLLILGCADDFNGQPTLADGFKAHCGSRQISVESSSKLMPVLELINHASDGSPYVMDQGLSLSGTFQDEVFARYRRHMDAFHFFFNYHFASPCRSTLSCGVTIDLPRVGTLRISRFDGLAEVKNGVRVPKLVASQGEIHLPFLELVNEDEPALPRRVFLDLMASQGLPASSAHQLFDGLLAHNRQVLNDFIKACDGTEGEIVRSLHAIATQQLLSLTQTVAA